MRRPQYVSDALGTYTATHTTKMMGAGLSQSRVSLGHGGAAAAPARIDAHAEG